MRRRIIHKTEVKIMADEDDFEGTEPDEDNIDKDDDSTDEENPPEDD